MILVYHQASMVVKHPLFFFQADCGPPDMTITVDPVCSEYLTPNLPTSTLYGTTLTFTCTSLLSKVQSTIDYCPVEACTADALWTRGSISCGGTYDF